jgi:hypothetical protein
MGRTGSIMVLQAVVSIPDNGVVQVMLSSGNDVVEVHVKEGSNPELCCYSEGGDRCALRHSPYKVSSIPLDLYSEITRNVMLAQDKERESMMNPTNDFESTYGWWGCCWIGWLGNV